MPDRRVWFLTPTYRPVGGVIKIFDYLLHAVELGYETAVWCREPFDAELPFFRIERFQRLVAADVDFGTRLTLAPSDLVYFSWPDDYEVILRELPDGLVPEQLIHIIQNVRHANPRWCDGYPLRLLSRPMSRIMTNDVVMDAVRDHVNRTSPATVIALGHDIDYFHRARSGGFGDPVRVAYTTWKSRVGDAVASRVGDAFEFRAVREYVPWRDLRDLYQWADVFLCTPNPEEGFYMPGLEAMAAGAVVLTPDVGGNRAYCDFGRNCLLVEFEQAESYVRALRDVSTWDPGRIEAVRERGYEATGAHTLVAERDGFASFLAEIEEEIGGSAATANVPRTERSSR